jgi:diketogulonate reductase-like aldo/keto reductase
LRWHIQKGIIIFPKSSNPKHIKENSEIFDFQLDDDEMAAINKMGKKKRFFTMSLEDQQNFKNWKPFLIVAVQLAVSTIQFTVSQ